MQAVKTQHAESGGVPHHVSVHHFPAFLALELLCVIFPSDAVPVELEVVTFPVSAEGDGFGSGELVFHLFPVVFRQWILDQDDSLFLIEPDGLLRELSPDQKFQGEDWMALVIQQGDVRTMPFDVEPDDCLAHLLQQVLFVLPDAVRTRPPHGERLPEFNMLLKDVQGLLTEQVMEEGFTVAQDFGFLEMGEVGALQVSTVSGDDAVSTEGAGIDGAFFRVVHMDMFSLFITSDGVQQFLSHRFAKVFFQR